MQYDHLPELGCQVRPNYDGQWLRSKRALQEQVLEEVVVLLGLLLSLPLPSMASRSCWRNSFQIVLSKIAMGTRHMCACVLSLCSSMNNHHRTTRCSTSIHCSYQQAQLQTSSANSVTNNHSYNQTLLPTSSSTNQLSYQPY